MALRERTVPKNGRPPRKRGHGAETTARGEASKPGCTASDAAHLREEDVRARLHLLGRTKAWPSFHGMIPQTSLSD